MNAQVESQSRVDIPSKPFQTEAAWRGEDLAAHPGKWVHRLTGEELAEIDRAIVPAPFTATIASRPRPSRSRPSASG